MPITFWGHAVLCAAYLLNRSPTKELLLKKTPYEALYGQRPYLGHIRIWACRAYAHIPIESKKRKKWDPHSCECLPMGYYDSENVYKLHDIDANSIIKVIDVIFFEEILGLEKFKQQPQLPHNSNILGGTHINNPDEPEDDISIHSDNTTDNDSIDDVIPDQEHHDALFLRWTCILNSHSKNVLSSIAPLYAFISKLPTSA